MAARRKKQEEETERVKVLIFDDTVVKRNFLQHSKATVIMKSLIPLTAGQTGMSSVKRARRTKQTLPYGSSAMTSLPVSRWTMFL